VDTDGAALLIGPNAPSSSSSTNGKGSTSPLSNMPALFFSNSPAARTDASLASIARDPGPSP
jgi:hypothetical protein